MDLGIKGKRALVLGGGKGIGRGIADALAAEGVDVAIASRNLDTLKDAADGMARRGVRTLAVQADLTDRATIAAAFDQTVAAFGGVDILVNNSGGPPPMGPIGISPDLWTQQFQAMVLNIIGLTDLALPGMRERKWGRILTVASSSVIQPIQTLAISNTLRASLAAWSKTLAGAVGPDGITVNMLLPGAIRTQRIEQIWSLTAEKSGKSLEQAEADAAAAIPVRRIGTIEEFGAVAAFLASTHAGYVTGSMIRIDGGSISSI